MADEKRTGGRKATGTLYWTKTGWRARLPVLVDGVRVKKSFDLETTDKAVARIKLARLVAQNAAAEVLAVEAKRLETFSEATKRIVGESGIRSKDARLARLRTYAFPAFGAKTVDAITAGDVRDLLQARADAGQSRQQCLHLRNDVAAVLGELWRLDMIRENVCSKVRLPKNARVDRRERAVLTDGELAIYLGWQHPIEKKRRPVVERQTMGCVSRMLGGQRKGDLYAVRWEMFDTEDARFRWARVPRQKTARPQLLEVPEMLRPILRDWWERNGRPEAGFVFPVSRGERAGEQRKPASPAALLRQDLRRAFGLEVSKPIVRIRSNGRQDTRIRWVTPAGRIMTARERELFLPTEFTKPVDFHSFRRAFKQAMADANVDLTQQLQLSGASDVKAHLRYLMNTAKMRQLPAAALPALDIVHVQTPEAPIANENISGDDSDGSECRRPDLNRRHHAYEARALTS
jgi:integrase